MRAPSAKQNSSNIQITGKRGKTVAYFDSEKRLIGNAMMTESKNPNLEIRNKHKSIKSQTQTPGLCKGGRVARPQGGAAWAAAH